MSEQVFPNKEILFLVLSRLLSLNSSDSSTTSLTEQLWSKIRSSGKEASALELADNLANELNPDFLQFIKTHSDDPDFPLEPLESAPGVQSPSASTPEKQLPSPTCSADPDRIYMDGCFDLMHSGHFNAIRQAKSLGKVLVVGVHSDEEISRNKGPPVMNEQERYALARSCKWIDEVVENAPYSPTIELLDSLNCRYAAHGDDLSINENGDDCMSILKRAGRCRIFKRTEGVSTTQIVGKLLLVSKESLAAGEKALSTDKKNSLTTSRRLSEFSNKREPRPDDVVVYMDGTFDLFHAGHVETMKRAKELGDYLVVGVHDDQTVNYHKGSNFPIMGLHDRVMCVLSTKYVDEVIIGAPWIVTKELVTGLNIKVVVQGTVHKGDPSVKRWRKGSVDLDEDPYLVPKEMEIYREIESAFKLDTQDIIDRIVENRAKYLNKFQVSNQREKKYIENKTYVREV